ncbi:peptide-methionine (R)-S-oxide reductase MsrB [uncultured Dokdonia sp.]|uniref:peptide-methionine (R)-S-oxide reductase MsrB n=1 Tax=uncultured Dokdonia sp. TaxID=575653 RepID=UPI002611C16F|nr:peptide-methionine (R)-S-oxide reductase MsrB [uncultured Dokdonia sp.]
MIRQFAIALFTLVLISCNGKAQEKEPEVFPVQKTDAEWKAELTADQYYILRQEGTERPFSSKLNKNYSNGTYKCAGCGIALFEGKHKFDSGTGWPSFDRPIGENVAYSTDRKLGYTRVEEHCANCGGHLGHVFGDGPRNTTGKRHCINGDALVFVPEGEE